MVDDAESIRRGFVSERRSLLITSFLLFFYQASGIKIDKINIFGSEAQISDSSWVPIALWTLWFYFFVRYYQYFRDTPDKGFIAAFRVKLDQLAKRLSERRYKQELKLNFDKEFPEDDFKGKPSRLSFERSEPTIMEDGSWRVLVAGSVHFLISPKTQQTRNLKKTIKLPRREILLLKGWAGVHVAFSTRLVTEYVLPFLVCLLPVVYRLLKR